MSSTSKRPPFTPVHRAADGVRLAERNEAYWYRINGRRRGLDAYVANVMEQWEKIVARGDWRCSRRQREDIRDVLRVLAGALAELRTDLLDNGHNVAPLRSVIKSLESFRKEVHYARYENADREMRRRLRPRLAHLRHVVDHQVVEMLKVLGALRPSPINWAVLHDRMLVLEGTDGGLNEAGKR
jgi:hypothetical protein